MKETLDAYQTQLKINNVINASTGALKVGAVVGVGYLGFLSLGAIAKALGYAGDIIEVVQDKASVVIFGNESITSEETGETIENPAHNIPIIGSLFSLGMTAGNKSYKWLKPETWGFD
jgi:hypothetical protein